MFDESTLEGRGEAVARPQSDAMNATSTSIGPLGYLANMPNTMIESFRAAIPSS